MASLVRGYFAFENGCSVVGYALVCPVTHESGSEPEHFVRLLPASDGIRSAKVVVLYRQEVLVP
jgi:hypothetical protein